MSDALPNDAIEARAADWLARQQFESWNEADAERLEAWLAESDNHTAAYWRLKAAFGRTDRLAALRRPMMQRAASQASARKPWTLLYAAVAALVVLAVGGGIWGYQALTPDGRTFATPVGGHMTVKLADGSVIELNTDTVLHTDFTPEKRAVQLVRGEAYFQVEHNAARPFTVTVGDHRIVDLGTKFFVRRSAEQLDVALMEGSARLESTSASAQTRPTVLMPGDFAVATATSIGVSRKKVHELADDLAWRSGMLVFHNARLVDAAAQFNRYGDVKLVVSDSASRLTINGAFPTNGAGDFAGVAHEIFGLHVDRRGKDIVLSR
jgi:transmembrane sensor